MLCCLSFDSMHSTDKGRNSLEIFQSLSADLITCIAFDLEMITDRLLAENIVGQAIVQFTTVGSEVITLKLEK